jgi:hypothetical protein
MTAILAAVATVAAGRLSGGLDRAGVRPPCGQSRDGIGVSQDRAGWPQIQSRITEGQVHREMIGAMRELPDHPRTDWSSSTAAYRSADGSSYTVVYTQAKEVS